MLAGSDTGRGMPSEVQARIFEPFYPTKLRDKGTDVGGATVWHREGHGGLDLSNSEPTHGAIYKVYIATG